MRFTYYDKAVNGYAEEMYSSCEDAIRKLSHWCGVPEQTLKDVYFASDCKLTVHTTLAGVVTIEEWWHYE